MQLSELFKILSQYQTKAREYIRYAEHLERLMDDALDELNPYFDGGDRCWGWVQEIVVLDVEGRFFQNLSEYLESFVCLQKKKNLNYIQLDTLVQQFERYKPCLTWEGSHQFRAELETVMQCVKATLSQMTDPLAPKKPVKRPPKIIASIDRYARLQGVSDDLKSINRLEWQTAPQDAKQLFFTPPLKKRSLEVKPQKSRDEYYQELQTYQATSPKKSESSPSLYQMLHAKRLMFSQSPKAKLECSNSLANLAFEDPMLHSDSARKVSLIQSF